MMRVLNKLADIKSDESTDELTNHGSDIQLNHSPTPITPRSIPSLIPRLQLDQLPMLPGFHQFRGFK